MRSTWKFGILLFMILTIGLSNIRAQPVEDRLQLLKTQLELNDLQTEQINAVLQQNKNQLESIRAENRGDFDAMQAAESDIQKREHQQIMALLNEKQQAQYADILEKQSFAQRPRLGDRSAQFLDHLRQELALSETQIAAITPALESFDEKLTAAQKNMDRPSRGDRKKMRKLMDERNKSIEKHLTDDQKRRFKELLAEQRKAIEGQRSGAPRGEGRPDRRW